MVHQSQELPRQWNRGLIARCKLRGYKNTLEGIEAAYMETQRVSFLSSIDKEITSQIQKSIAPAAQSKSLCILISSVHS